jgi:hypothetical protein
MGFASGFRAGYDTVRDIQERRRKEELRKGLQRAGSLEPSQQTMADPEMIRNLEGAGINPETGRPYYSVRDGYVQPNFDVETTAPRPVGLDQTQPGVGVDRIPVVTPGARGVESRLTPAEAVRIPETTQYQLGGRTQGTQFSPEEVNRARTEEMARVYEQQGMPEEAMRMRQLAQQQELSGLQLGQARRQEDYNTTLQEINKKKFSNPTERTAAILAATEAFDPATALKLRNEYTQAELNDITLKAKKFEQNYGQSRAKGLDAVIEWYDSVNDGFTLRREGNQIIQTDTAGNQRVFAQGTDDQIMMRMDAIAKPGGFLELAKIEADMAKSKAQEKQALATARYLDRDRPRAGAGLAAEKPLTAADVKSFMEVFGDTVVGQGADRKPITLRDLPPNEAIAYINSIRGGGGGTSGLPDVPQGGLPLPGAVAPRPEAPTQGLVPANPRAARAATARQDTIPQPPPQTITTRGGVTRVNPDYLEWERQYGRLLGPQ